MLWYLIRESCWQVARSPDPAAIEPAYAADESTVPRFTSTTRAMRREPLGVASMAHCDDALVAHAVLGVAGHEDFAHRFAGYLIHLRVAVAPTVHPALTRIGPLAQRSCSLSAR